MTTLEIIKNLCETRGISVSALERELGFSNGSIAKVKVLPSDRLYSISKFFGVTMEYLITGKDVDIVQSALIDTEIRHNPLLADAFRKSAKLDDEKQKLVIELINKLSE